MQAAVDLIRSGECETMQDLFEAGVSLSTTNALKNRGVTKSEYIWDNGSVIGRRVFLAPQ